MTLKQRGADPYVDSINLSILGEEDTVDGATTGDALLFSLFTSQGQRFMKLPAVKAIPSGMAAIYLEEYKRKQQDREQLSSLSADAQGRLLMPSDSNGLGETLRLTHHLTGGHVFGGSSLDTQLKIPNHSQFKGSKMICGGGFIGVGWLTQTSHRNRDAVGTYLGCFVPFPDVVPFDVNSDRQLNYQELRWFLRSRFSDQRLLDGLTALERLESGTWRKASDLDEMRLSLAAAIDRVGPVPRWIF